MAYDDGFYYGQCKIICEAETIADNGKTVSVTSGSKSWSGEIVDKLFECLVPGRGQYTITLFDSNDDAEWTGTVEAGYGECIHQMLADGYEPVMERMKLSLDEIEAAPGSVADYVPDADAVKELNSNLTANNTPLIFDYKDGKYGYNTSPERGADTFFPFSNIGELTIVSKTYQDSNVPYTVTKDAKGFAVFEMDNRNYGPWDIKFNGVSIQSQGTWNTKGFGYSGAIYYWTPNTPMDIHVGDTITVVVNYPNNERDFLIVY